MNEHELFAAALEIDDPDRRAAYLDRACGGDHAMRARVEALLRAHEQAGSFLQAPPVAGPPTLDTPRAPEGPGTVIGPYKLLQPIGEGGMGTVYMAEQTAPVKRRVALKVIKAGMDTRQVLARFDAERQALALMDHPHIARVLDAGATDAGRPYFVMELVKGVPITRYCDDRRLTLRERLELFVPVCQAVQHAHQKGIIHRDLKPSNILVAQYDGRPVPKVIDFGVAKATGPRLTERTLYTEFGSVVGTLEYMSPEQAELNQLDIDTRSDIYALGVLLYELLTGTTPLTHHRVKEAALLEVLRVIREEEPPQPSVRLSTTEELPSIAAVRGVEPARLSRVVRGELDWIVMKALEKDRNRRYATANDFAQDVRRYLADEPVQACPPSAWYRLRKLARRNKTALVVAGLVLSFIALLGGGGGWVIRDRAARRAQAAHDLDLALDRADLFQREGKRAEALAALDRAELLAGQAHADADRVERLAAVKERLAAEASDQRFTAQFEDIWLRVATQVDEKNSREERDRFAIDFSSDDVFSAIRDALGRWGIEIGAGDPARTAARVQGRPDPVRANLIAALDRCLWRAPKSEARTRQWLLAVLAAADSDAWRVQVRRALLDPDGIPLEPLARAVDVPGQPPSFLLLVAEKLPQAMKSHRLELLRKIQRAYPADLWGNHQLAVALAGNGRPAEAVRYFTAALALRPDRPLLYRNRAQALVEAGEPDAALADYRQCVALAPQHAWTHINLGNALRARGQPEGAIAEYREALRLKPDIAGAHLDLGVTLGERGRLDEAIAECREALRLKPDFPMAYNDLGAIFCDMKHDYPTAEAHFREAIRLKPDYANAHVNLGHALTHQGKLDEAIAEYREALRLGAELAGPHDGLGVNLPGKGQPEVALAEIHYHIGLALVGKGKLDEALAEYRETIRLNPDHAEVYCNVGDSLRKQGDFVGSLAMYRKGHELGSKRPGWPHPSAQWVAQAEQFAALAERLPRLRSGEDHPRDANESLAVAQMCYDSTRYAAAARFWAEAFRAQPRLAADMQAQHRYNAACATALAGCGRGKDTDRLDEKERARLRRQAVDWLRADLEAWRGLLDTQPGKARSAAAVTQVLRHWLSDPDFAGVRGSEALARLPEAERRAWQELWSGVDASVARAQARITPETNPVAKSVRAGSGSATNPSGSAERSR
jgi:serine/threonine protein kinase/tetratricopeptide (TPR) repeat protein